MGGRDKPDHECGGVRARSELLEHLPLDMPHPNRVSIQRRYIPFIVIPEILTRLHAAKLSGILTRPLSAQRCCIRRSKLAAGKVPDISAARSCATEISGMTVMLSLAKIGDVVRRIKWKLL